MLLCWIFRFILSVCRMSYIKLEILRKKSGSEAFCKYCDTKSTAKSRQPSLQENVIEVLEKRSSYSKDNDFKLSIQV